MILTTTFFLSLLLLVQGARPIGSSFGVPGQNATYDYVVIGGGTGGLTIATRLVEQGAGSVAVSANSSHFTILCA